MNKMNLFSTQPNEQWQRFSVACFVVTLLLSVDGVMGWSFVPTSERSRVNWKPSLQLSLSSPDFQNNENDAESRTSVSKFSSPSRSLPTRRRFMNSVSTATTTATIFTFSGSALVKPAMAATEPKYDSQITALDLVEPNSLTGQVMVITGATTGLGMESAKALAKGGATVVMTARTEAKGTKALATVQDFLKEQGIENPNVFSVQLDLDNLENVRSFPDRLKRTLMANNKPMQVDVLMNNAGVMAIPDRQLTADGFERTFQSNHLGHFVLTAQLAPYLREKAKIINVSSLAYQIAGKGLKLDNLNGEKEYSAWGSYGQSKLENILFTQELQRRVDAIPDHKLDWTVMALHPGGVNTDLARNMMGGDDVWFAKKQQGPTNAWESIVNSVITKVTKTPEQGAATQVYLAATDGNDTQSRRGQFFSDLKSQKLPSFATDAESARALWEQSESLAGIKFVLPTKDETSSS